MNFQMFKLVLEKAEEPEIKLPTSIGSSKKNKRIPKKIYFCSIDYAKAFDHVDHNKLWEILQEMGIPDHLTYSWEICMQVKKKQLELDMEQQTGAKLGKLSSGHGLEKVSFHSNPKERQCQRMLKLPHNCTHLTC